MSPVITTLGLSLDIVGVLLLFRFGLPPSVRRGGGMYLKVGVDQREARKAARYDWYSRLALVLIILGFALQIAGAWIG